MLRSCMPRTPLLALAALLASCAHSAPPEVLERDVANVVHAKKTLVRDLCCYTSPAASAVVVVVHEEPSADAGADAPEAGGL